MIAVIYDPETGAIAQSMMGEESQIASTAAAHGALWLAVEMPEGGTAAVDAFDVTHRVVDGALVAIGGAA